MAINDFKNKEKESKFEELYLKYEKCVYYMIQKSLGNYHEGRYIEEAFQEIFLRAFCNMDKMEDIDSFRTKGYIFAIGKTVIANIFKREIKINSMTEIGSDIPYNIESGVTLEEHFLREEELKNLKTAIDMLDEDDRKIIRLKFFEEKTNGEISKEMGISYENTCVRIMRAKEKLKKKIKK